MSRHLRSKVRVKPLFSSISNMLFQSKGLIDDLYEEVVRGPLEKALTTCFDTNQRWLHSCRIAGDHISGHPTRLRPLRPFRWRSPRESLQAQTRREHPRPARLHAFMHQCLHDEENRAYRLRQEEHLHVITGV